VDRRLGPRPRDRFSLRGNPGPSSVRKRTATLPVALVVLLGSVPGPRDRLVRHPNGWRRDGRRGGDSRRRPRPRRRYRRRRGDGRRRPEHRRDRPPAASPAISKRSAGRSCSRGPSTAASARSAEASSSVTAPVSAATSTPRPAWSNCSARSRGTSVSATRRSSSAPRRRRRERRVRPRDLLPRPRCDRRRHRQPERRPRVRGRPRLRGDVLVIPVRVGTLYGLLVNLLLGAVLPPPPASAGTWPTWAPPRRCTAAASASRRP
jgi:hypothetical protein